MVPEADYEHVRVERDRYRRDWETRGKRMVELAAEAEALRELYTEENNERARLQEVLAEISSLAVDSCEAAVRLAQRALAPAFRDSLPTTEES